MSGGAVAGGTSHTPWRGDKGCSRAPPRQPALRDYPLPSTRTNTHTFLRPPFLCWNLPFVYRSVLTRSISDSVKEPHKLSFLLWLKMVLRAVLYSLKPQDLRWPQNTIFRYYFLRLRSSRKETNDTFIYTSLNFLSCSLSIKYCFIRNFYLYSYFIILSTFYDHDFQ